MALRLSEGLGITACPLSEPGELGCKRRDRNEGQYDEGGGCNVPNVLLDGAYSGALRRGPWPWQPSLLYPKVEVQVYGVLCTPTRPAH